MPEAYNKEPNNSLGVEWQDKYSASKCWQTTAIYKQIGKGYPYVVA